MILKTNHFDQRKVDPTSFAEHLKKSEPVDVFDNLGRNARLVVPTSKSDHTHYKHLGAFLNHAPSHQAKAAFRAVGKAVLEEMNKGKRIWLSTAGLGVIWLHIRLDTIPGLIFSQCHWLKTVY